MFRQKTTKHITTENEMLSENEPEWEYDSDWTLNNALQWERETERKEDKQQQKKKNVRFAIVNVLPCCRVALSKFISFTLLLF